MDDLSKRLDDMIAEERLREIASGTGNKARTARYQLKRRKNKDTETCPEGHAYTD
jgi:hypothetical protein